MSGWIALVLGLAVLVVAVLGFRRASRLSVRGWRRIAMWSSALVFGAALSLSLTYPVDERTRVYGFPLPAAAFQRDESGRWLDFVGPLTAPFMLINFVVLTGVTLYVVCAVAARFRKHGQSAERIP